MSCHCGRTAIAARAGIHNHGPWLWIPGSRASPVPPNDSVVSPLSGAEPIETFLLLVIERVVDPLERGPDGAPRRQHRLEPLAHRLDPACRRARQRRRARRLELVERVCGGVPELVEDGALGVVRLDRLGDARDLPIRQPCGLPATEIGFDASAGHNASCNRPAATVTAASIIPAGVTPRRFARPIGAALSERI